MDSYKTIIQELNADLKPDLKKLARKKEGSLEESGGTGSKGKKGTSSSLSLGILEIDS
jgi:hypothetical protein